MGWLAALRYQIGWGCESVGEGFASRGDACLESQCSRSEMPGAGASKLGTCSDEPRRHPVSNKTESEGQHLRLSSDLHTCAAHTAPGLTSVNTSSHTHVHTPIHTNTHLARTPTYKH